MFCCRRAASLRWEWDTCAAGDSGPEKKPRNRLPCRKRKPFLSPNWNGRCSSPSRNSSGLRKWWKIPGPSVPHGKGWNGRILPHGRRTGSEAGHRPFRHFSGTCESQNGRRPRYQIQRTVPLDGSLRHGNPGRSGMRAPHLHDPLLLENGRRCFWRSANHGCGARIGKRCRFGTQGGD